MSSVDSSIQSFIIRIWVEEQAESHDAKGWRGHITHVPTGKKHYLNGLDDISSFMRPYLTAMGIHVQKPPP